MNHLGLVGAIEDVIGLKLPVISCPKCSTFWSVLFYVILTTHNVAAMLAVSFLASYLALWLELLECIIDKIYLTLYGKITAENINDTPAADSFGSDASGTVSKL